MSHSPTSLWPGDADARALCRTLFDQPGLVFELRAVGVKGVFGRGVVAGYFDDPEKFIAEAALLDGKAEGVYVTLNPVAPSLLARAHNRLVAAPKSTTGDNDIIRRRLLLIDVDAGRPSGISATDEERQAAFQVLREILSFLGPLGFPAPVKADSGNGGHLLYTIDLPPDDGGLVQRFLEALAFRFNNGRAQVDQKVFNCSRISKLYGTLARKGDERPDRPHRRSRVIEIPEQLDVVPRELLEKVAAIRPEAPPRVRPGSADAFDVSAFLARHGFEIAREGDWHGGRRWVLATCPFDSTHTDSSAYVLQFANGAVSAGCHHNGCAGKGWRELREQYEPRGQKGHKYPGDPSGPSGTTQSARSTVFGEPESLPNDLPPVLDLDPRVLPSALREWIQDIADRVLCPLIFVAVAVMVALAGVIGRVVGIRPKRHDDWLVIANLWGMLIGRPGIMKTPAIQEALKPLKRLEIEAKKKYEAAREIAQATALVSKEQERHFEKEIRKELAKEGGDPEAVARKVIQTRRGGPTRRRFLVNDATIEKLGELLNENPRGVTIYRDELIGLLKKLEKAGQEEARSFYLEGWNGNGRFTVDRIGRGTIDIEYMTFSVLGSIQPGPLSQYLDAVGNDVVGDDGFVQRFQLAVWPDIDTKWINVDRWPDTEARRRAFSLFQELSELDPLAVGATKEDFEDDDEIPYLQFAPDAQEVFDEWRSRLENLVRSGKEHPAIESHLSKFRSLIPSLALLSHLADRETGPVSKSALDRGIFWGQVLESHARRIYGAAADLECNAARALSQKLLDGELEDDFTIRDVYRRKWSGLNKPAKAQAAVDMLVEYGWLIEITEPTDGRPRKTYLINPRIWEMCAGEGDGRAEGSAADSDARSEAGDRGDRRSGSDPRTEADAREEGSDRRARSADAAEFENVDARKERGDRRAESPDPDLLTLLSPTDEPADRAEEVDHELHGRSEGGDRRAGSAASDLLSPLAPGSQPDPREFDFVAEEEDPALDRGDKSAGSSPQELDSPDQDGDLEVL